MGNTIQSLCHTMKYYIFATALLLSGCTNIYLADMAIPFDDGTFYTVVGGQTKTEAHSRLVGVMKAKCQAEGADAFQLISLTNTQTGEVVQFTQKQSKTSIGPVELSDTTLANTQGFDFEARFQCINE